MSKCKHPADRDGIAWIVPQGAMTDALGTWDADRHGGGGGAAFHSLTGAPRGRIVGNVSRAARNVTSRRKNLFWCSTEERGWTNSVILVVRWGGGLAVMWCVVSE